MKKKPFTLLELSCAMGVLMVFMFFLMKFYTSSQDVMNRAMDKTDQFETARIAMDLIANDLQNIYYTEGVPTVCYYQENQNDVGIGKDLDGNAVSSTMTTRLSIPVLRQEKPDDSSVSSLVYVTYVYDPDTFKLKIATIGDSDTTKWNLSAVSTDPAVVFPEPAAASYEEIVDGVLAFQVIPKGTNDSGAISELTPSDLSASTPPNGRTIPNLVSIEITMLDKETNEAIRAFTDTTKGMDGIPDAINPRKDYNVSAKSRTFAREVVIDRGQ